MVDKTRTPRGVIAKAGQIQQSRIHTTVTRLNDCIGKIIQALTFYGFDSYKYSTKPTLDHWAVLSEQSGGFMPFMKYKLAAFYAACQGQFLDDPQEIPLAPFINSDEPHILLGGRAYRFIRFLANKNKDKFHEFLVTILQIKKGLERPDEELLKKGSRDTYVTLTTPPPESKSVQLITNWADVTGLREQKCLLDDSRMEEEIRRTVREVFKDAQYTDLDRYSPFFPSTSANYIRSRSKGGAIGEILLDEELMRGLKYEGTKVNIFEEDDFGFSLDNQGLNHLYSNWETLYKRMFSKALTEIPFAEPVALAEALKVRVITKGPPMLNTVLKPLQKFLWKKMKEHKTFHLIGNWVTTEYLAQTLGSTLKPDSGFGFLSVDYKDATNKMRGLLSEVCADEISDVIGLNDDERVLFIRALTGHIIVNPDNLEESKPQLNGQLMGSIISFPILCLINASILRLTRELDCNRLFALDRSGVIVNGDDGLLKATPLGVSIWKSIGNFCGLAPSVGKVYYSRRFFNINSTTYEYTHDVVQMEYNYDKEVKTRVFSHNQIAWEYFTDLEADTVSRRVVNIPIYDIITKNKTLQVYFKLVKYINFGLLYDMSRSTSDTTNATTSVTSVGERANELLRTCPEDLKESVLSFYMGRHLKFLIPLNLPWYIPENLGGLGITPLPGTRHQPSQLQLRIATKAYLCDVHFPVLRPTDVWQTWKLALKTLPSGVYSDKNIITASIKNVELLGRERDERVLKNEEIWSLQNVRSLKVVECIFNHDLKDLMGKLSGKQHTIEMNYYRKLARANLLVSQEHTFTGMPLSKVQPFEVGKFPLPRVDTDNVPFVTSSHPLYSFIDDINESIGSTSEDELD
jgi:hypothetical protein